MANITLSSSKYHGSDRFSGETVLEKGLRHGLFRLFQSYNTIKYQESVMTLSTEAYPKLRKAMRPSPTFVRPKNRHSAPYHIGGSGRLFGGGTCLSFVFLNCPFDLWERQELLPFLVVGRVCCLAIGLVV
jgi:hypothetical protein